MVSDPLPIQQALDQASEQSRKYEWLAASKILHQLLETSELQEDLAKRARVQELLAKSYFKAAFQSPTHEEFVERMKRAGPLYDESAVIYQKQGLNGLARRSEARSRFTLFWLSQGAAEQRGILEECISMSQEAIKLLEDEERRRDLTEARTDALTYLCQILQIWTDWQPLKDEYDLTMQIGETALKDSAETNEEQVETLTIILSIMGSLAQDMEEFSRLPDITKRIAQLTVQTVSLAKQVGTADAISLADEAAAGCAAWNLGDYSEALTRAEEGLRMARQTKDSYLIGRLLIQKMIAAWSGEWSEENVDHRRELLENGIALYPEALRTLEISAGPWIGQAYWTCSDMYVHLASFVETQPERKKAQLQTAVELARKIAPYEDYYNAWSFQGSKSLYFLAKIETDVQVKRKLLNEALTLREMAVRKQDLSCRCQARGAVRSYLALIKAELASVTEDQSEKVKLLRAAVEDQQQCSDIYKPFATDKTSISVISRYLQWFGDIVLQLFKETNEHDVAVRAVNLLQDSIEWLEKAGHKAAIPGVRWKIAKTYDAIGRYAEASSTFDTAAEEYRINAKTIAGSEPVFSELASYMQAWALIEKARIYHGDDQFLLSAENYSKASDILRATKTWNYLSKHYTACSYLEGGEALGRQERQQASIDAFTNAIRTFQEGAREIEAKLKGSTTPEEREEAKSWVSITKTREKLCTARIELEQAKLLDKKGQEEASGAHYRSASDLFSRLSEKAENEQTRRELYTLKLFCDAWAEMKEAEASASPELYAKAAASFIKVENTAPKKRFRLLALADASICRALEHGTQFRRTRNSQLFGEINKQLETATDYYQQAGLESAAAWTRATGKLFDALVYMADAASDRESKKRTDLYQMAEKHLQLAVKLYDQAGFVTKSEEAQRHLQRAREEKELLLTPVEALAENPAITGSVVAPVSLVRDKAVGLERFDEANVVGNLSLRKTVAGVGSELMLELELANVGQTAATLMKLENVVPDGLEIDKEKIPQRIEDNFIDMKGRRLEYLKTHEMKIPLKPKRKGAFELRPRILFVDEKGKYRSYEFEPVAVTVTELGFSGWLKGPK